MKHLLLILLLTFGLSYSASGQEISADVAKNAEVMVTKSGYANSLMKEICAEQMKTPHFREEMFAKARLWDIKLERGLGLADVCYDHAQKAWSCLAVVYNEITKHLAHLDQLIAELETTPRQCLNAYDNYLDQQIIATDQLIAELESILLSGD